MPTRRYVKTKFTNEEQQKLIKLVESMPGLCDRNHPDFRNNRARDQLWRIIAKQLRKEVFDVKKRWRGIRDYRRMKNANASIRTKTDTENLGQLRIIKVEENLTSTDGSLANNEISESSLSDHPEKGNISCEDGRDSVRNGESSHKPSMGMLFSYYGQSVSALPPDLQRRCKLDIMEIINRYEEMAAYREFDEDPVIVT